MPLSRKPIPIGLMAVSSSGLPLSFRLTTNENYVAKIDGTGPKAVLVLADPSESNKFSGFGGKDAIDVTIEAYRNAGNGYHAATLSKPLRLAPSKSAFFEARRMDDRYDSKKSEFVTAFELQGDHR